MPFTGVSAMDRKREFVVWASVEGANVREVCRRFGISPTLGYRVLARYQGAGVAGLEERSRRPANSPGRTAADVEAVGRRRSSVSSIPRRTTYGRWTSRAMCRCAGAGCIR
jgi:transposase